MANHLQPFPPPGPTPISLRSLLPANSAPNHRPPCNWGRLGWPTFHHLLFLADLAPICPDWGQASQTAPLHKFVYWVSSILIMSLESRQAFYFLIVFFFAKAINFNFGKKLMGFKHLSFISFLNYYHQNASIQQGLGSCEWFTQSCCWLIQWPKNISHYKFQVTLPQKKEKKICSSFYTWWRSW